MPVHAVPGGFRWGRTGKVYRTRGAAQKQAAAIYASGWREDASTRATAHRALRASPRAESAYTLEILRIMGRTQASVLAHVGAPGRRDANDQSDARFLRGLFRFQAPEVQLAFDFMAQHIEKSSKKGAAIVGIRPSQVPGLGAVVAAARARNVRLIQSATEDFLDDVRETLDEHAGAAPDVIAKALEERVGVSKSRARTIAVDQTLKVNASLNEHRQRAAGVSSFRWSSVHDERTREAHRELDGRVFSWDGGLPSDVAEEVGEDAGVTPGEPVNCRCVAVPVVLGLEAEGSVGAEAELDVAAE